MKTEEKPKRPAVHFTSKEAYAIVKARANREHRTMAQAAVRIIIEAQETAGKTLSLPARRYR
jgi:hypothetical protein